jgi:hypothetical protein
MICLVSFQLDDHLVGVIVQLSQVGVDIKLDVGHEIHFHVQVDLDVYSIPCRIDEVTVDRRPSSVIIMLSADCFPAASRGPGGCLSPGSCHGATAVLSVGFPVSGG